MFNLLKDSWSINILGIGLFKESAQSALRNRISIFIILVSCAVFAIAVGSHIFASVLLSVNYVCFSECVNFLYTYILLTIPMYFDDSAPIGKVYSKMKLFYYLHTYFSEDLLSSLPDEDAEIIPKLAFKDMEAAIRSKNADEALLALINNYKLNLVKEDESSILSKLIAGLKDRLSQPGLTLEEVESLTAEMRALVADSYHIRKELKAARTREDKLAARRERAAKRKAALESFYSSDLYGMVCFILGFDLKQKIKSLVLNSKWITVRNHPTCLPEDFTMNFFTYDIEAILNDKGDFVPYQFGLYHPDLGYKSFYGFNCMGEAIKFILHHNYSTIEVSFYAHNAGKFDALFIIKELNKFNVENMRILKDKQNSIFFIEFVHNGITFKFKDSFKLMPLGLDKLLKDFNIQVDGLTGKLPFNHDWMSASS